MYSTAKKVPQLQLLKDIVGEELRYASQQQRELEDRINSHVGKKRDEPSRIIIYKIHSSNTGDNAAFVSTSYLLQLCTIFKING